MADRNPTRSERNASFSKESYLGWLWRRCTTSGRHKPCFWRRNTQTCSRYSVWRLADSPTTACYCSHRFVSRSTRRSSFGIYLQAYEEDLCKRFAMGKAISGLLRHRYRWNEDFGEENWLEERFLREQVGTSRKITAAKVEVKNTNISLLQISACINRGDFCSNTCKWHFWC